MLFRRLLPERRSLAAVVLAVALLCAIADAFQIISPPHPVRRSGAATSGTGKLEQPVP